MKRKEYAYNCADCFAEAAHDQDVCKHCGGVVLRFECIGTFRVWFNNSKKKEIKKLWKIIKF